MDQFRNHPLYMRHNIDSAMSTIWDFYRKRFVPLFLMSFVMSLVIQYLSSLINLQELTAITEPEEMMARLKDFMWPIMIISVVSFLFNLVLQYYVMYKPVDEQATIFSSVVKSLVYFFPYLIAMILLSLAASVAVVLGFLMLVVGVIFAVIYIFNIYMFIAPVMLAEGPHIGNTLQRSVILSHRKFWTNLGWVTVFIILLLVISVILSGVILLPFSGSFIKTLMNPGDATETANMIKNPLFIILSALTGALTMPLMPLFSAVLYFNGRAREEDIAVAEEPKPEENRVKVEDLYAKPWADDHPDNPENTEK